MHNSLYLSAKIIQAKSSGKWRVEVYYMGEVILTTPMKGSYDTYEEAWQLLQTLANKPVLQH